MGAGYQSSDDGTPAVVEELAQYVEWEAGNHSYENAVTLISLIRLQFAAAVASFSLFGIHVMIHT